VSQFQVAYLAALIVMTLPLRQGYALSWLWGNLVATLAACGLMDMGWLGREGATLAMLTVDLITGVGLALGPGIGRLIAWGYAITAPIYTVNLVWGVSISATFGIIHVVALAQLGVFAIGLFSGGDSGGNGGRRLIGVPPVAIQKRNGALSGGAISPLVSHGKGAG
jgi:hypothetical protein